MVLLLVLDDKQGAPCILFLPRLAVADREGMPYFNDLPSSDEEIVISDDETGDMDSPQLSSGARRGAELGGYMHVDYDGGDEAGGSSSVGGGALSRGCGLKGRKKRVKKEGEKSPRKRVKKEVKLPEVPVETNFNGWVKKGPPMTIRLSTAIAMQTPIHWETKKVNTLTWEFTLSGSNYMPITNPP